MSLADTFTGARSGLAFLFAYQHTVAQAIGRERALELNKMMTRAMGTAQGEELREQVGVRDSPPRLAASLVGEFLEQMLGIQSRLLDGNEGEAVIKVGRCPIYEAAEALGMENAAIEALCRSGSIPYMDAIVKQFNPDLAYELRQFRPSADGSCIETIVVDGR
jgi:hypothetical protein